MSKIVGIDLGTTNSLVAVVDSGIPYVIADAQGQRLLPSVVHFPGPGAPPVVGHPANRVRVLSPQETVYSVKRFMGRRGSDIPREEMLVTYPVRGEGAGPVTVDLHGRPWSPEEISAEILKELRRTAESALGEPVTRAVADTCGSSEPSADFPENAAASTRCCVAMMAGCSLAAMPNASSIDFGMPFAGPGIFSWPGSSPTIWR